MEAVEMGEMAEAHINHLSYGQKKRICIAGLLSMGHEVLLMDEPTAGLDPMGEYRMMDLLTGLNRDKGVTIVMASHSVDMVPLFLSRLFILSKGKLKRGGTPEEVFTAPEEMEPMSKIVLDVPMMYADHHVSNMRSILLGMSGVEDVIASSAFRRIEVTFDPEKVAEETLLAAVVEAGYAAQDGKMPQSLPQDNGHGDPAWERLGMRMTKTNRVDQ